jgi:hypothetical protein
VHAATHTSAHPAYHKHYHLHPESMCPDCRWLARLLEILGYESSLPPPDADPTELARTMLKSEEKTCRGSLVLGRLWAFWGF